LKAMLSRLKRSSKRVLMWLPVSLRKRAARLAERVRPGSGLPFQLLSDLASSDVEAFHRFLWSEHLAYADTYEIEVRFGARNIRGTRRLFAWDLRRTLRMQGIDPASVESALDIGSSMGYLLRHLETSTLPGARRLDGIDIDGYAIQKGQEYLRRIGSRVRLVEGDVARLERYFPDARYDVVLCCGVLMYLEEETAAEVVASALRMTRGLVALSGLAHPDVDNAQLDRSVTRSRDCTYVHNFDRMIQRAGGELIHRRWEGGRLLDGNGVYFAFGVPRGGAGAGP